ncbi:metal ABC transporter substrate-binding protein [Enterococcus mundtii]|uniref:Zinc ABC transporter substrate-binding protein n=1 Tax=Enterococcus mundtii TaxID=53346 RepID=A0A2S7RR83_ENTMU|nr:metal ABC transporter substrate-binding protein [Enterococcus mundtii]PQF22146.1 zinc ABC transporter substrate-binding protein [Enterococcus mundtii]
MKKYLLVASLAIGAFLFTACGQTTQESAQDELNVVATFYPMYEFTKEVVGDTGKVELLIPAGTEPHDFEPSAKQSATIADADVFVYNSSDMEFFVDSLKDTVDTDRTLMIEAAKGIERLESQEEHEEEHEESEGHQHDHAYDPHVWLDPTLAIQEVQTIATELGKKYPDMKDTFDQNAAAYIKKLEALDQTYTEALKGATNRTFVTQHAAFAYLANRYDLKQVAISGVSPDQEPTPSRLAELKDFVDQNKIEVIYFEENASSKVAETLSKETGVKLEVLNPLESLTNEQIEAGETYISTMEKNLEALKESIK